MALWTIFYAVILLAGLVCPSTGDAVGDMKSLQKEFWDWRMSENPSFSTYVGIYKYNDRIETYNVSQFDVTRAQDILLARALVCEWPLYSNHAIKYIPVQNDLSLRQVPLNVCLVLGSFDQEVRVIVSSKPHQHKKGIYYQNNKSKVLYPWTHHTNLSRLIQLGIRTKWPRKSSRVALVDGLTQISIPDTARTFLERLNNISRAELDSADQVNYDIMHDTFQTFLDGSEWARYGSLSPMSFLSGIQLFYGQSMPPSATRGDFENYIVRLHLVQRQIDEIIESFQLAVQLNRTLHNVSVTKVPAQIEEKLFDDPTQSLVYKPFMDTLENSLIPDDDRISLRNRGRQAVESYINAFRQVKNYMINEYMPQTRKSHGIMAWDPTHNYYRACLRWHLSFNMIPEEVHAVGLKEVERISRNMNRIVKKLGFSGSVKGFFDSLLNDRRFYSNDSDFILEQYRKTVFERINPNLPRFFKDIHTVPLKLEKATYDGIRGGYIIASEDSPGLFIINLFRPLEVPFFQMMALSLHEANPGHHLQHSYSMYASLPDFRKNSVLSFYNVPNWFPFYSAYQEGWALYSEYLGEEMGLYKDDYEMMGRYSFEILRAVRLVVDTGIHYYGWSRDKAIEYMINYTGMGTGSAANEIDRYITWPGQACAYKIGEIKIKDLRKTAELRLGSAFDIKEFHSVILENGAMPLSVLERLVYRWIQDKEISEPAEVDNTFHSLLSLYIGIFISVCNFTFIIYISFLCGNKLLM